MANPFENIKAGIVKDNNNVLRLSNGAGLLSERPYEDYVKEGEVLRKMIVKTFPELEIYVNLLTPLFTYGFDTFATGCGYLLINPNFWDKLRNGSDKWWYLPMFVYLHEIYHNIFDHMNDGEKHKDEFPDHNVQNRAMDYSINGLIEKFYDMEGVTAACNGLISKKLFGKTWKEIYPILLTYDELNKNPWNRPELKDVTNPVSDKDSSEGGNGGEQPPKVTYSEDYKAGYASQYQIIKKIVEDCGSKKMTTSQTIEVLKKEAELRNLNIYESVNTSSKEYNDGVVGAWKDSINRLKSMVSDLKGRTGDSELGSYQDDSEKLKNAIDDLMKQVSSGDDDNSSDKDNGGSSSGSLGDDSGNSNSENNPEESPKDIPGDESSKSGDNAEKAKDRIKAIVKKRGLQIKDYEPTEEERSEVFKNHTKHLESMAKDEDTKELLHKYNKEANKYLNIEIHESSVDWKKILEDFVASWGVEVDTQYDIDSIMDFPNKLGVIRKEKYGMSSNELNHIVFGLDNSGSVFGSGDIPMFLGELVNILDSALDDDCIIDFIQFSDSIDKCTRIAHKKGDSIEEIKEISNASGGGTDYRDVMYQMSLLMDEDVDSDDKDLVPEFRGDTVDYKGTTYDVGKASCSIIFTDQDLNWGETYADIDTDKLLIFVIGVDSMASLKNMNPIFRPCVRLLSLEDSNWDFQEKNKKMNESVFDDVEGFDDNINKMLDDDEYSSKDLLVSEYDYLVKKFPDMAKHIILDDGKLILQGNFVFDDNISDLSSCYLDGAIKIRDSKRVIDMLPYAISKNSGIIFYGDTPISDKEILSLREKYNNENVFHITKENLSEYAEKYQCFGPAFIIDNLSKKLSDIFITEIRMFRNSINGFTDDKYMEDTDVFDNLSFYSNDDCRCYMNIKKRGEGRYSTIEISKHGGIGSMMNRYPFFNIWKSDTDITVFSTEYITDDIIDSLPVVMGRGTKMIIESDGKILPKLQQYIIDHRGSSSDGKKFQIIMKPKHKMGV